MSPLASCENGLVTFIGYISMKTSQIHRFKRHSTGTGSWTVVDLSQATALNSKFQSYSDKSTRILTYVVR